jgi:hypothetical protein
MTEDQLKLAANFEARVRQLMFLCEELKRKNAVLEESLTSETEKSRSLQEEIKDLNLKYDNLKFARIIEVKQGDFQSAKKRLSKLVREVDKCIALLNE